MRSFARNPYQCNKVNLQLFYGEERHKICQQLVRGLATGNSFGVVGGRRIGKTTLLRCTEKALIKYTEDIKKSGLIVIPIYVDIQTIILNPESASEFYESMTKILDKRLYEILEIRTSNTGRDFESFKSYLIQIKEQVSADYDLNFAFIFDEIELLTNVPWGEIFFNNWRALLSNTEELQNNIAAVFCGASEMRKLSQNVGSPLQNILNKVFQLKLFSQNDTQQLISQPINYDWESRVVDRIQEITGGHPFLIQYIMQEICYNLDDIEAQITEASYDFITNQKYQFENWWNKFDSVTRNIYDRLYRGNKPLSIPEIAAGYTRLETKNSLETLAHTGVIIQVGDTDESLRACIAGTLFRDWYVRFGNLEPQDLYDHVRRLIIDQVEPKLKTAIATQLEVKYGSDYLQKQISTKYRDIWKNICHLTKVDNPSLSNHEIMNKLYFREVFIILLDYDNWQECADLFVGITSDIRSTKDFLFYIKRHLNDVRNSLSHTGSKANINQLIEARIHCEKILDALS